MTALVAFLLCFAPKAEIESLLRAGKYADAVRRADTPKVLFDAVLAVKTPEAIRGVARRVVHRDGVLREPLAAAEWLAELARRTGGNRDASEGAGYLLLVAKQPAGAIPHLERAVRKGAGGRSLAYLADAYRKTDAAAKAEDAVRRAWKAKDRDAKYVQDIALQLASTRRGKGDAEYADLLEDTGLALRAAMWLAEDLVYGAADGPARRKKALALFAKSLDERAPAEAFWAAAQIADGEQRFVWLVAAVRKGRGETGDRHATPGALLELARECAQRKRPVAAAALAKQRLRLGECPAAWEVLEALPAALAR